MKIVHDTRKNSKSIHEWTEQGKELESKDELDEAAKAYEKVIQLNPYNENAYHRLMIIYRKLKDYRKELATIKAGIKSFEEKHHRPGKLSSKKISSLSLALRKSTGLADKKGNPVFDWEPVTTWKKRMATVAKKMKA